jgi:hypothetical protein
MAHRFAASVGSDLVNLLGQALRSSVAVGSGAAAKPNG